MEEFKQSKIAELKEYIQRKDRDIKDSPERHIFYVVKLNTLENLAKITGDNSYYSEAVEFADLSMEKFPFISDFPLKKCQYLLALGDKVSAKDCIEKTILHTTWSDFQDSYNKSLFEKIKRQVSN